MNYTAEKRLAVVLAGLQSEDNIRQICKEHDIDVYSASVALSISLAVF